VPSTKSKGKPAEKPKDSMRKLVGCKYTRQAAHQPVAGSACLRVVETGFGEEGADMMPLSRRVPLAKRMLYRRMKRAFI